RSRGARRAERSLRRSRASAELMGPRLRREELCCCAFSLFLSSPHGESPWVLPGGGAFSGVRRDLQPVARADRADLAQRRRTMVRGTIARRARRVEPRAGMRRTQQTARAECARLALG